MKKLFLKLNMALIFIMILFANVTVYSATQDNLIDYLKDNLKFFDARSQPVVQEASDFYINSVTTFISKETLEKLEKENIQIVYYWDGSYETYLGARIGNDGPITKISAFSDSRDINFAAVRTKVKIADTDLAGVKSLGNHIGEIVELDYTKLDAGEGYAFILTENGISVNDTSIKYTNDAGTETIAPPEEEGYNDPEIINEWFKSGGSFTLNEDSMSFIEGINEEVYAFKVNTQGTYKIPGYSDNIVIGKGSQSAGALPQKMGKDETGEYSEECVILYPGNIYYFRGEKGKTYEYSFISKNTDTSETYVDHEIDAEKDSLFETIEKIMSNFILSIARVINWLIGKVVGRQLTLDDIIFNKFSEIRLDFFKTDVFGNSVDEGSLLIMGEKGSVNIPGLREPITVMYNFFKNLTLIGYLIILIYMGIKIMLSSTSAKKKATYKETFKYWVTGIIILFFMPYFMKYVIALDEAIVKYISDDSGIRSQQSIEGQENATQFNKEADKGFLRTTFEDEKGDLSKSVIDYSGKDYMSSIGKMAANYERLGYSIAFLILTWQIITLLIYYYKRVFIIALLIMIFPLIAFTYTWDKLNDGRSQALSAWMREFTITVFVQVFHAIVYVFITNTIYATIQTDASGNAVNADFILLIIASSFLFAGEDILKRLFGGGGESLGSATQSAAKIAFITRGVVGVTQRTVKEVAGKDGYVRSAVRSIKEERAYAYLSGNTLKDKAKRLFTGEVTAPRMEILAKDQERHNGIGAYLPKEGNISPIINESAEMLYDLNNGNTPKEVSDALKRYHKLMDARNGVGLRKMTDYERRQFDEMMKKSGINIAQLDNLDRAMENAAIGAAAIVGDRFSTENRNKMKSISQNLRIEIEAIFPAVDDEGNKLTGKENVFADRMMNVATLYMAQNGIIPKDNSKYKVADWNEAAERIRKISNETRFAKTLTFEEKEDLKTKVETRTNELFSEYVKVSGTLSKDKEKDVRKVAKRFAILEQRDSGFVYDYEMANAIQVIEENKPISDVMKQVSNVDVDIETLSAVLALKIKDGEGKVKSRYEALAHIDSSFTPGAYANKDEEEKAYNTTVDKYIEKRQNEILSSYTAEKGKLNKKQLSEAKAMSENFAKLELFETGIIASGRLGRAKDSINGDRKELAEEILKHTNIKEKDISRFNALYRQMLNVEKWAENKVNDFEEKAQKRAEEFEAGKPLESDTPEITIYDFVEAASTGRIKGESRKSESVEDMLDKGLRHGANEEILKRKKAVARRLNMLEKVKREKGIKEASEEFGTISRNIEGYNNSEFTKKEILYDGYTADEMKELAKQSGVKASANIAKLLTNVVVTPVTTVTGLAIGTAVTEDFMPFEESLLGGIEGNKFGAQATKIVDKLSAEKERQAKIQKIKDSVNSRIKGDEKERLNAKTAFEDAAYKSRDGLDGSLVFNGANATMHLETDGTISATVNVMADNAVYMSISEEAPIPSGGWQPYQESAYYQFQDKSPATQHTLYIYVRDRSGNILGKRISGIHL